MKEYYVNNEGKLVEKITSEREINIAEELLNIVYEVKNTLNELDRQIEVSENILNSMGIDIDLDIYLQQIKEADKIDDKVVGEIIKDLGLE